MYEAIEEYYKVNLRIPFPSGLPSINLLEIAKGQDEANSSFMTLLIILFMGFIQSDSKEKFINCILALDEASQSELMTLIQEKSGPSPLE